MHIKTKYLQDGQTFEQKFLRIIVRADNANDTTVLRSFVVACDPQARSGCSAEKRSPRPVLRLLILRSACDGSHRVVLHSGKDGLASSYRYKRKCKLRWRAGRSNESCLPDDCAKLRRTFPSKADCIVVKYPDAFACQVFAARLLRTEDWC